MDHVAGESRSSLWPGIADTIRAHGGNLLCFTGGYLLDPHVFNSQGNVVYDFIDHHRLDGLIIWSSSLSSYVGIDSLRDFCDRFRPLPMVSIGVVLDGIPGIVLDSYQGMREVMTHLVEVHHRQRLAFIRGPDGHRDADERYRAYVDALRHYHLPFATELISPHYKWFDPGGRDMVHRLLDERRAAFDAVVCVNDDLAVQAMETLQARGLRVPEDVSVVGFNDTPLSRAVTPPLTTVPWRMHERGRKAVELLLAMLDGEPAPEQVLLPAGLIVRQSCGCFAPSVAHALAGPLRDLSAATPVVGREAHLAAIAEAMTGSERMPESVAQLYDAFGEDVAGAADGAFLVTLDRILRQTVSIGADATVWQRAVSALRRQLLPGLAHDARALVRAEDLWQQARVMIGEQAQRALRFREWQAQQQTARLRRISHALATTNRVPDLMDMLVEELPHLDIPRCYLALYEDPLEPTGWCRVVLAYDEDGRRDVGAEGQRIRVRDLAMGALLPPGRPFSALIQPLHFQTEQLGVVMFEQQPAGDIHEVLREEISATLKGVMLAERNEQLYAQALEAQQVAQEGRRLAEEANRLKSRFLSMVSHELRTPLVLLVGLSEMMLRERTGDSRPPLPEPYRQDLARIHVGAQQLDSLVRDVLDLTRSQLGQLRLVKEPLDLGQVLGAVALVGEQMARSKGLTWEVAIPEGLPKVHGDASRLRQVAFNLVANAVKFTVRGHVRLTVEVDEDALTVVVSDTGPGVPQMEQEAIFDEFRQSERTTARGFGGLGIGLAICRELIELHDGQIGVRSSGEEESGSAFYFTLPTIRDASDEAPSPQEARPRSVLLLTSREGGGARLQAHLAREGFQVASLSIEETPDWLPRLLALAPGAVILDGEPASARGWQLIEALRENPATRDIPVFFYALQEPDAGAMLALSHQSKPLGATALTQALQQYGLAATPSNGARIILIVDDDPSILDMHTRVVRAAVTDCRTLQANNGRRALEVMRAEQPALVLLDLMMPELDGMGVLAAMQEDPRLRGIPVIVLTAQTLTDPEMTQLNQGVAAVLEKGLFTVEETLGHIEQALARDRRLGNEAQRTVRKAMAFIHERHGDAISRDDIASHAGVSARHLTRCFQQEMGLSPIAYLSRYRVLKAKQLLDAGGKNITEVAAAVGFSSSSYFTDAFRREVGVAPRDYQRRNYAPKSEMRVPNPEDFALEMR